MHLSEILKRDANNLDVFRIIAACMVIYGHAFAMVPKSGSVDIVARLVGFDYSGSLAVKMFFFLSGLVVTNSLIEKGSPVQFVIGRFFRIWPALFLVLVVTAFILGPIFTTSSLSEYFFSHETYSYISSNLLLQIKYMIPGVFEANPLVGTVNGALWTIPYEVFAYLLLLGLFMLNVLNFKRVVLLVFFIILLDPLVGNKLLFTWLPQEHEINLLAPCFAFGSVLAYIKTT